MNKQKDHVVLSLSGGLDSSTLLLRCISEYKSVTAISFDYGQKHRVELERAQSLVDYLCYRYDINYRVIKLDGLTDGLPIKSSEMTFFMTVISSDSVSLIVFFIFNYLFICNL
jgi:7-cyano-7-deazaguanine synthase in queuosine biosynthesis